MGNMHPAYNPHRTFLAAWLLAESVYGEGLWAKDYHFETLDPVLPPAHLQLVPYSQSGACCTTGGLSLWTFRGVPNWIETPWGEWQFASRHDSTAAEWFENGTHRLRTLRKQLDIDDERSYFPRLWEIDHAVMAIRSIGDIVLPPYEHVGIHKRGVADPTGEWMGLCVTNSKPLPEHNSFFAWLMEQGERHVERLEHLK